MRRTRLFSLAACCAALSAPASAQWQVAADVGASRLQRTDIPQSNAVTFGASATGLGDRSWIRSSVLGVVGSQGQTTGQALMAGSLLGSSDHSVRGELTGAMSAFGQTGGASTVSGELMARAQIGTGVRGGAFGLGAGTTAQSGSRNALFHAASDAWWTSADDQIVGTVSLIRRMVTIGDGTQTLTVPRSYADLSTSWRRDRRGIVLGASGGARAGIQSGTRGGVWGSVDATAWVSSRSAIAFSAGRTLEDPVRGIPRTTFLSLALHLSAERHLSVARGAPVAGARVSIERLDESRRRIEVRGVTGSRIEVMGDFTDWNPVALEVAGDTWRLERAISPGLHRIALRVDGGEWIAPVNLPHATDDLGGVVGLITVP